MGRSEVVGGGYDEQDLRALAVNRRLDANPRDFLQFVHSEIDAVLEPMRLDAQVVARAKAVGRRFQHPVDIAPHQIEQLPADHGHFCRVDAIGTKNRAATALGALVEVIEPFLEHVFGEFPGARQLAQELTAALVK